MDTNLEKQLIDKYPTIFRDRNRPPTESLICFGLECNNGWYKILDHLFGYLTNLMETDIQVPYSPEHRAKYKDGPTADFYKNHWGEKIKAPRIILSQVKEKYGILCIYYYTDMDEIPEDVWAKLNLDEYYSRLKRFYDKVDFAIGYAEYQSEITCEVTGRDGKLYNRGWHRVLCQEEAIKNGYNSEDACKSISKTVEY